MKETAFLNELHRGQSARVLGFSASPVLVRRLRDLGLTEGVLVRCVQESPLGDPRAFLVRGAVIALRSEDSARVLVERHE